HPGHHEPGGQRQAEPLDRLLGGEQGVGPGRVLEPVGNVLHPVAASPTASTHRRYLDTDRGARRSPATTSLNTPGMAARNLNSVITSSPRRVGPSATGCGSGLPAEPPRAERSNVTRIGPSGQ